MGLAKGAIKILMQEMKRKPFSGSILTLGRQDIFITYEVLQSIAKKFRVALQKLKTDEILLSSKEQYKKKNYIADSTLFKALGFSECKTLDISDYESADYIFDLNESRTPKILTTAFDVIIDGGTTEHVFNIPKVLQNIFNMLKFNGRIIHMSPMLNYVDHGFYMFSPRLFWDFYLTNKFEINSFELICHKPKHNAKWKICKYLPEKVASLSLGGFDSYMYALCCISTKTKLSSGHLIPQGNNYVNEKIIAKSSTSMFSNLKTN
ncbi:MAG: hypothetical protein HZB76_05760 [Chlamydiae bacterium]|nr:hypothetical protein [Chlamydiota bacterium]